ncbi:MAG TPA: hypothetical protein VLA24_16335 [Pseudomonadales bacterium]|nr:hypothetical protein [Pseudomonadales bacterium]
MDIRHFTRPQNKLVKLWPLVSVTNGEYTLTKYNDGKYRFFNDRAEYAMMSNSNLKIFNQMKEIIG